MEIVYQYARKRRDFGRQCNFTERKPEVLADIMPDPSMRAQYIYKSRCDASVSCAPESSSHQVNTERFETSTKGINHFEGGWPSDIDPTQIDQVTRYRKKVEKDEAYMQAVLDLGSVCDSSRIISP
jgi:dynein intermediate chain 2, axonemal